MTCVSLKHLNTTGLWTYLRTFVRYHGLQRLSEEETSKRSVLVSVILQEVEKVLVIREQQPSEPQPRTAGQRQLEKYKLACQMVLMWLLGLLDLDYNTELPELSTKRDTTSADLLLNFACGAARSEEKL